jgi:hypothetical protein
MSSKLDEELESQIKDPHKIIPQLATVLYLFETRKGGHTIKRSLKRTSPHAYYKIYLEPLFNALIAVGVHVKENDGNEVDKELNSSDSLFYRYMMTRAGYFHDCGQKYGQMSILWSLQNLMKNKLDIKEPFRHVGGKYLGFNSVTSDVEVNMIAYKEHFLKKAFKIKEMYKKNSSLKLIYQMSIIRAGYKVEFGEDMPEF